TLAEVEAAWEELGCVPVAVRSSAWVEDGARESHAGQFTTVLQVDKEGLAEALAQVRKSVAGEGWVIVQRMVAARVARVAFTTDPTCAQPAARVEAVPGLGEGLVSGRLRPSAWRVTDAGEIQLVEGSGHLAEGQVGEVAATARRIATLLGGEQDVEF